MGVLRGASDWKQRPWKHNEWQGQKPHSYTVWAPGGRWSAWPFFCSSSSYSRLTDSLGYFYLAARGRLPIVCVCERERARERERDVFLVDTCVRCSALGPVKVPQSSHILAGGMWDGNLWSVWEKWRNSSDSDRQGPERWREGEVGRED